MSSAIKPLLLIGFMSKKRWLISQFDIKTLKCCFLDIALRLLDKKINFVVQCDTVIILS